MPSVRLVVVGASTGGVEARSRLVAALPERVPAAVFVALHVAPGAPSVMPRILVRAGALSVRAVDDGETVRDGHRPAVDPARVQVDHVLPVDERAATIVRLVLATLPADAELPWPVGGTR